MTHQAALDLLIADLRSNDMVVRRNARASLVGHGRSAVEALLPLLKDRSAHVRWEAVKVLREMSDASAAPALADALEDEDFGVAWLAAEGLIHLRRRGLASLFQALIAHADSPRLRQGAHHVLRVLADRGYSQETSAVMAALDHVEPTLTVPAAARQALEGLTRPA
jgi:hypothetical protein